MSELFDLKTFFLLGQYQAAINEASKIRPRDEITKIERDIFVYRAFIEQGNCQVVLDELDANQAPPPLRAVRALAACISGKVSQDETLALIEPWLTEPDFAQDDMVLLMMGFIYERLGNLQKAMQCVFYNKLLEAYADVADFLIASFNKPKILLKLRRPDLAEKELKEMQRANEFAIPTLLSAAWVNIALGGAKIQEAQYIFEDLTKKYGSSFTALHGIGVCRLMMQKYQESEESLLLALEKNAKSVDTIVNLITLTQLLGKQDDTLRFQNQLRSLAPNHPYLTSQASLSSLFDKSASKYTSK